MILSLCLGSLSVGAQVKEFVVEGHVNLPMATRLVSVAIRIRQLSLLPRVKS